MPPTDAARSHFRYSWQRTAWDCYHVTVEIPAAHYWLCDMTVYARDEAELVDILRRIVGTVIARLARPSPAMLN